MEGADAKEDVIDTSDVEEREIMEALKPGYYERVWGVSELSDGQNMDVEVTHSSESYNSSSQSLTPPPLPASPIIIPSDPGPLHRKYSLRHRSAKQLNPFQYDKRLYKRQLQGMPEAIVKDPTLGRTGRKERYRGEGEDDWEQEEDPGPEGNENEEWRARERRNEKQLEREAQDAKMRRFGIRLASSEDETLKDISRTDALWKEGQIIRGKKRKRGPRYSSMMAEVDSAQASSSSRHSTPQTVLHIIPRPRPRPNYQGPSSTPQPQRDPSLIPLDIQMDVDHMSDGDTDDDDPWLNRSWGDGSSIALGHDMDKRKLLARGSRNRTIEGTTRDGRRLGAGGGHETKLTFPRAERLDRSLTTDLQVSSPSGVTSSKPRNKEHRVEDHSERDKRRKAKKNKHGQMQSTLFIVHRDGHKITSGRPRQIIHVDDDDDAFHEILAPVDTVCQPHVPPQPKARIRRIPADHVHYKFRHSTGTELDPFDMEMNNAGQQHSEISLDFDIVSLPSGLKLGPDSYIGKGRLYELISVLKGNKEVPSPISVTLFGLEIDPDMPITQISSCFASACDKLYDASTMTAEDQEVSLAVKAANALMHTLCQMVTFRALHIDDNGEGLLVAAISEQIHHLVTRINERVQLVSADGHSMDYRSFTLYWFSVEMHLRLVYAQQKRERLTDKAIATTTHSAEQYCVQLLCRLLEHGLDRTIGLLQNGHLEDTMSNPRALELWICIVHIAPYFTSLPLGLQSKPTPTLWRIVEAAMDAQANKPDSRLYESERIWRITFSLCAVSQFSPEGLSTSTPRLVAYWPIVRKALKCIRLSADIRDNSKPASTLHKRDTYLRLVTARCFLLCTRWNWHLNEAEDMFQELCAIFRSRQFSNLLGEPDDFPMFIREGNESLLGTYQTNDTAFGLFLKLIVRASKDFGGMDGTDRLRGAKLVRLLSLAVPVGSTAFTKNTPPTGQGLSMLYNRYSAIFVAIYVDSSARHVRYRLQQVRRYITFKDADYDSRTAAIRSMMHIAILLRHLSNPLDDILLWASEMFDVLIAESISGEVQDGVLAQIEKDKLVVLVQLLLGSIRIITNTSTLSHPSDLPSKYPDIGLLQAWMSRILSSPLAKDHRTGLEICKCIQSFLAARRAIFPLSSLPKPGAGQLDNLESQDEYGDGGLDLYDPTLLAFLADIEDCPDENAIVDHHASDILDAFSQPLYTCVCMHLVCKSTMFGGPYYEADQWLDCWLGYGSVLVRNKKRDWNYYLQLGESAWKDISDSYRRIHLRLQFMLTALRLDPSIYKSHGNQIRALWFECIVSPTTTIEHTFTALLFSVDGLRHPLWHNIPCVADPETGCFTLHMDEFKQLRLPLIEAVLSNVANTLDAEEEQYVSLVVTLLSTVRKWIEVLNQDTITVRQVEYLEFGKKIFTSVQNHDALTQHPNLQNLLNLRGIL